MEIALLNYIERPQLADAFACVRSFGLTACQLSVWDETMFTPEVAADIERQRRDGGVRICALWAGLPPPMQWNFTGGPVTLGLIPPEYRAERIRVLKRAADFAKRVGAPAVATHCGFIPENLTDPLYPGVVAAIRHVAEYCRVLGLGFWFETGQETPVTLLRTIQAVGLDNLGVNLDPANLLMYGKGNPIDALDVFGSWVRNVHVKDGRLPTDGNQLGKEVKVGTGQVDFPKFLARLRAAGFDAELVIEREIPDGEERARDIAQTIADLERWWKGD